MTCCCRGATNSPVNLRQHLTRIDLIDKNDKRNAEIEVEKLFKDARVAAKDGPISGEDYHLFLKAVFDYLYGEMAERKAKRDDIVHPAEIDQLKKVIKESLD